MANTTIVAAEGLPRQPRLNSRYRIVGELGSGAFGPVCVAEDITTGSRAAIRLLPTTAGQACGGDVVERISRAIVAASAAHPALVRVLDAGRAESGRPFVVTELVEGRRLSDVLASGPAVDVPAALAMALELGGAVETIHNMGLVHGALRSRNVMLLADGRVKLMDLELANLREPPAMPTEPITEKTDIYAFATVVYEMLCGVPPLPATTSDAVLGQPAQSPVWPPERRAAIPRSVRRILEDALSEQQARRPFMSQLLNGLVLKPSPTGATRWRRAVATVGGAAVAMSFGGLVTWGPLASRPSPISQPADTTRRAALEPASVPSVASAPFVLPPSPARDAAVSPASAPSPSRVPPPAASAGPSRSSALEGAAPLPSREAAGRSASTSDEGYDASAVIDWLLTESARRGQ